MINTTKRFNETKTKISSIIVDVLQDSQYEVETQLQENLMIHLSIALIRIQSDNYINLSKSQVVDILDSPYYKIGKDICSTIEKEFEIKIPDNEIALCALHISQNDPLDIDDLFSTADLLDDSIFDIVHDSLIRINDRYNTKFGVHDKLFSAIGLHMQATIERVMQDCQIENPLVDQIKERHETEYNYASVIDEVVFEKIQKHMTDDEIAFVALHFVVAINKSKN